ncbi:MAG: ATP-binding protein [Euryarchaeota archaeon]|nr:ATP-binding protein [Euryarchaeota archaeon]
MSIFNPWWNDKPDPHISIHRESRFKVTPSWIMEVILEPRFLNVVSGPKCVGKTTGIKLLISNLLEKVDATDILYVNCEAFWMLCR